MRTVGVARVFVVTDQVLLKRGTRGADGRESERRQEADKQFQMDESQQCRRTVHSLTA